MSGTRGEKPTNDLPSQTPEERVRGVLEAFGTGDILILILLNGSMARGTFERIDGNYVWAKTPDIETFHLAEISNIIIEAGAE